MRKNGRNDEIREEKDNCPQTTQTPFIEIERMFEHQQSLLDGI